MYLLFFIQYFLVTFNKNRSGLIDETEIHVEVGLFPVVSRRGK